MALRSQGPPGLASNRDRREAPPWRVLPLVVVVNKSLIYLRNETGFIETPKRDDINKHPCLVPQV